MERSTSPFSSDFGAARLGLGLASLARDEAFAELDQTAPYGYADDLEGFLDRLPCLYGPAPAACADPAGDRPFDAAIAEVILIEAESSDKGAIELITAMVREELLARIASTEPDYRSALLQLTCSPFYPYGVELGGLDMGAFETEADGRFACRLFETLPATGPITRCAQLERYGRRLEAFEPDAGREICEVNQVRQDEVETRHGWVLPTEYRSQLSWPEGEPELGCVEMHVLSPGVPTFTWISRPIAGATFKLRCEHAASSSQPSCDDL